MSTLPSEQTEASLRRAEEAVAVNAQTIQTIVDRLVAKYCGPLDEFMGQIKPVLEDTKNPITDDELEAAILKISALCYFTGDAMENLGIRADIAESIRREAYHKARGTATGTVDDKNTVAEMASLQEAIIKDAYERAYRKIKLKLELGQNVYSALKRVMNKRALELERLGYKGG